MNATAMRTSLGKDSLAYWLSNAIHDYMRHFGREPKLIVLPWWRGSEMCDNWLLQDGNWKATFRGVPFCFSMTSNLIELS